MTSRNPHNLKERQQHHHQQSSYNDHKHRADWSKNTLRTCGSWTEQLSSKGKVYYYNVISEKSQWDKPQDWTLPDVPLANLIEKSKQMGELSHRKRSVPDNFAFDQTEKRLKFEQHDQQNYSKKFNNGSPHNNNLAFNGPPGMGNNALFVNKGEDMDISAGSSPICNRSDISCDNDLVGKKHLTSLDTWSTSSHLLNSIYQSVKLLLSANSNFLHSFSVPNGYKFHSDGGVKSSHATVNSWIHADLFKLLRLSVQTELRNNSASLSDETGDQLDTFLMQICSLAKISNSLSASDDVHCFAFKINRLFSRLTQMALSHINNSRINVSSSESPVLDILCKGLNEIAQHRKPLPTIPKYLYSSSGDKSHEESFPKTVLPSVKSNVVPPPSTCTFHSPPRTKTHTQHIPPSVSTDNNNIGAKQPSLIRNIDFSKEELKFMESLGYINNEIPDHDESVKAVLLTKAMGEFVNFDIGKKYQNPTSEKLCKESHNDFLRGDKLLSQTFTEFECEHKKLTVLSLFPSVKSDIYASKRKALKDLLETVDALDFSVNTSK